MQLTSSKINLLNLTRPEMEDFFTGLGEKAFRASQLIKWIYQFGVDDFDAMTNISKNLRSKLKEVAVIRVPKVVTDQKSEDGTHKWVLEIDSGNHIETVFILSLIHISEPTRPTRASRMPSSA